MTEQEREVDDSEAEAPETAALDAEVLKDLEETDVNASESASGAEGLAAAEALPRWDSDDDADDEVLSRPLPADEGPGGAAVAPPARRPASRPGMPVPLGVRPDKGQGLLADAASSDLLGDMDCAIAGLDSWRARHKTEMDSLQRRMEQDLEVLHGIPDEAPPTEYERMACELSAELSAGLQAELAALESAAPAAGAGAGARGRQLSARELELLRFSKGVNFARAGRPVTPALHLPEGAGGAGAEGAEEALDDEALLREADELLGEEGGGEAGAGAGVDCGEEHLAAVEDQLVNWAGDLEAVLTKMDALSSGYQASTHTTAA